MSNVLADYAARKKKVISIAEKAFEHGFISSERKNEIIEKIESGKLTLGVIGQMKAGKSTFLNAFIFEDNILPNAVTPMTAALTKITYGQKKEIEVEFYNREDWDEQKNTAGLNIEDYEGNPDKQEQIKSAKELMEKSKKLGSEIDSCIGKTKRDFFDNLIQYVGADGKYVGITKSVTIYYPQEYLKGVEIVDTPGTNDPIVSRERRTKEFLKECDGVILLLYAGQTFNEADYELLYKNVRECGAAKVLIGVNKYDEVFFSQRPETREKMKENAIERIRKGGKDYEQDPIYAIVQEHEPIVFAALYALLGKMNINQINKNSSLQLKLNAAYSNFGITSQRELWEKSYVSELEDAVKDVIINEKERLLLAKPKNEILAAINDKKAEKSKEISEKQGELTIYETPDKDLEETLTKLKKAQDKLNEKIKKFRNKFSVKLEDNLLPEIKSNLIKFTDKFCESLKASVSEKPWWKFSYFYIREELMNIDYKVNRFATRDIEYEIRKSTQEVKKQFEKSIDECFDDIDDITSYYLTEFDQTEFLDDLKDQIRIKVNDELTYSKDFNTFFEEFRSENKCGNDVELKNAINKWVSQVNFKEYEKYLEKSCTTVIDTIENEGFSSVINSLIEKVEEKQNQKDDRENKLKELSELVETLKKEKETLQSQANEIEAMM